MTWRGIAARLHSAWVIPMKHKALSALIPAIVLVCLIPLTTVPQALRTALPSEMPIPAELLDANVDSRVGGSLRLNADTQAQILGVLYRNTLLLPWEAERAAKVYLGRLPEFDALSPPYEYTIVGLAWSVGDMYHLLAYVVQPVESLGFLVLSADERIEPLIAYSGSSVFPWDQDVNNVLLDVLGEDLGNRIAAADANEVDPLHVRNNAEKWNQLTRPTLVLPRNPPILYASLSGGAGGSNDLYAHRLIKRPAIWVQDQLPFSGSAPACVVEEILVPHKVGCVALAMADVLYHHEAANGTTASFVDAPYTVTCPSSTGSQRETRWHSDNLALDYSGRLVLGAESEAIGKLVFGTGVSVITSYGQAQSLALFSEIPYALCTVWGYASERIGCAGASDTAFFTRLAQELEGGRPLLLDLDGKSVDHAVVCDGRKERDADLPGGEVYDYHLRLGFFVQPADADTAEGNAWYSLPQAYPGGYTAVDAAVVGIKADHEACAPPPTFSVDQASAGPDEQCAPHTVRFRLDQQATITFAHYYWWPCEQTEQHKTVLADLEPGVYTLFEDVLAGPGVHTFAVLVERGGATEVYADQVVVGSACGADAPDGLLGAATLTVCCDSLGGTTEARLRLNYSILVESVSHVSLVVLQPGSAGAIREWVPHPTRGAVNKLLGVVDPTITGTRLVVLVAVTNRGIVSAYASFEVDPP